MSRRYLIRIKKSDYLFLIAKPIVIISLMRFFPKIFGRVARLLTFDVNEGNGFFFFLEENRESTLSRRH